MAIIHDKKDKRLKTHLQFFFTNGGGVFTIIHSPYDDEEFTFHLVSLVNHEIIESYDDLPTIKQLKDEIGEFESIDTDNVIISEDKKD
ncbi:hypothetical protein [Bacillus pinisoli]|uniref:hypothetical protein n=1 Tax=Bacillus pinisoli TaxID=2901866 RepID=UPI001FF37973|nr:hypothetical protein [Bacillus pinisoli]